MIRCQVDRGLPRDGFQLLDRLLGDVLSFGIGSRLCRGEFISSEMFPNDLGRLDQAVEVSRVRQELI